MQKLAHGGTVPGVDAIVVVKMGTCHGSGRLQNKGIFVNIWPKNTVCVYFFDTTLKVPSMWIRL